MININPSLTKEDIFKRVSQEQIVEFYLKTTVTIGELFNSPFRKDVNPSCSFKYFKGVLRFRDWTEPKTKDCFDIVQEIYNCSYNEALNHIYNDMVLDIRPTIKKKDTVKINFVKEKPKFDVEVKPFSMVEGEYLKQFGITRETCRKFNVVAVNRLFINEKLVYTHNPNDPALGYYFGVDEKGYSKWKIYFFKRNKQSKGPRFLSNTNRIQGLIQLPPRGDFLVITKSLKDVMVLDSFDINSVAMQGETMLPYDYIIEDFKRRFTHIATLLDFDRTGVMSANKLRKMYDIPAYFLTNGRFKSKNYMAKDISDVVKNHGKPKTAKILYVGILYHIAKDLERKNPNWAGLPLLKEKFSDVF